MIKQFILFFTILFFSIGALAQEKLVPLNSNEAYPTTESLEKGFRMDYEFVCNPEQQTRLAVTSVTKPDCGAEDGNGSVTLEIINAPTNLGYIFTYQTAGGEVEIEPSSTNTLTLNDLEAGPYIFTASGNAISDSLELWYSLDNVDTQPIPTIQGNFVRRDVFCDELGSIGFSFDVTDRKLPIFRWSTGRQEEDFALSASNLRVQLAPSLYYFRDTTSKSECHAYQLFEIGREATIDTLPFIEDFSTSLLNPDDAAWQDDFAFVNQTMAYQPLSIGVATLDGFDEFGQPYQPISVEDGTGLIDGAADVLTSRSVCYNRMDEFGVVEPLLSPDDDEVFLQFYYQPQGMGDFPNSRDSLKLSFLGDDDNWYDLWKLQGPTKNEPFYPFKPVDISLKDIGTGTAYSIETHIAIRDSVTAPYRDSVYVVTDTLPNVSFLFDGFQFQFSNNATVSGFNDHWNIDYIRFDKKPLGTIDDLTPIASIPSILNDYQAIPWTHFVDNLSGSLKEEIFVPLTNNSDANVRGEEITLKIGDVCTGLELYEGSAPVAVLPSTTITEETDLGGNTVLSFRNIDTEIISNLTNTANRDSAVFEVTYQLTDENDFNQDNNLLYEYQKFFNYYAYDDGTAEVAYGLEGAESQLAMAYNVLKADVLQGIQLNFVNMNSNDEKNSVRVMVWDSIGIGTNKSRLIYSEEIDWSPQYVPKRNGFFTIPLATPLAVDTGTIYIGFEQDLKNPINIGFDRNNDASSKVFFNSTSLWFPSIIEGAVMMRPVFGKALPVGIKDEVVGSADQVVLYPNPSNDRIYFKNESNESIHQVHIFDFSGRVVAEKYLQNEGLDIRELPNGLYLVKTYNAKMEEMSMHKLVKE